MLNNLLPVVYGICVLTLLWQAARLMLQGFQGENIGNKIGSKTHDFKDDRTGQITIHPEILNQDGNITDEDLLTVRFSKDVDPSQSADTSAE
tara:strand:- start:217 stop:492 length:276 start_codon:yes stop_codon:yes gene_type:complete